MKSRKAPTLLFVCSAHGEQPFSATVIPDGIVLKCGCAWHSGKDGLTFTRNIPYRERWWEQTVIERIKYAHCANYKCKRRSVAYFKGDYWCAAHLKARSVKP